MIVIRMLDIYQKKKIYKREVIVMAKKSKHRTKILLVLTAFVVVIGFLLYARAFPRYYVTIDDIQVYLPPFWKVIYDRHIIVLSKFPFKQPLIFISKDCKPDFQVKTEAEKLYNYIESNSEGVTKFAISQIWINETEQKQFGFSYKTAINDQTNRLLNAWIPEKDRPKLMVVSEMVTEFEGAAIRTTIVRNLMSTRDNFEADKIVSSVKSVGGTCLYYLP